MHLWTMDRPKGRRGKVQHLDGGETFYLWGLNRKTYRSSVTTAAVKKSCCCRLTLSRVKNPESVVTQRCRSPRKIRKIK